MYSTSNNGKQNVQINLTQKPEHQNEGVWRKGAAGSPHNCSFSLRGRGQFLNGCGPMTNVKQKQKQKKNKELSFPQSTAAVILAGLSHGALGLGRLQEVEPQSQDQPGAPRSGVPCLSLCIPSNTTPKMLMTTQHGQPSRPLRQNRAAQEKKNAPISACVNGRAPFLKVCLHLEGRSAKHNSSVSEETTNALQAQLLSLVRTIKTSSLPLPSLKQHIHKLGMGEINCSINISKDSRSGKLYSFSQFMDFRSLGSHILCMAVSQIQAASSIAKSGHVFNKQFRLFSSQSVPSS